jgi:hypothetical protein
MCELLTACPNIIYNEDNALTSVELTSVVGSLVSNVAALQFVFNGFENGGTAYREFDVLGEAATAPEPAVWALGAGLAALTLTVWRRRAAAGAGAAR